MPTLSDLVQRTKQYMYGYTVAQQQFTYLTNPIGSGDVAFAVNDPAQVSKGLIEVDGGTQSAELMNVNVINRSSANITLLPNGRGFNGTTAVSHLANASIENNPIFPQARVIEAVNAAIRSVYPQVFAVGVKKITKLSVVYQYAMPSDSEEVVSVFYDVIGPSQINVPMINYQFFGQSNSSDFGGVQQSIYLGQDVTPGRTVTVNYKKEPSELVNLTDDFATVTGLPSTVQDVVIWRACANLTPALEGPRLILDQVEANERAAYAQPGMASKVAQYFETMANNRLMLESMKQYDRYPLQIRNSY